MMKSKKYSLNDICQLIGIAIIIGLTLAMIERYDKLKSERIAYNVEISELKTEISILQMTPTPTPTATPTPTPTNTPTPTPKPTPICQLSNQEWYDECLARGLINGVDWDNHITKERGGCYGPSGRETYYNLRMDLCVWYMRELGYSEEEYPYWIRDDGAKMLGNYVMCAANWSIRPKGTIIPTSLGDAIVVDTGDFVKDYPYGVDLAVDW